MASLDSDPILHFIHSLPKAELHSHLAGSIRDSTLRELLPDCSDLESILERAATRTLSECFQIFDVIHKTINTAPTLTRIVQEMVADNAADNVVYLEIRTTPRRLVDYEYAEGTEIITMANGQDLVDAALHHYVDTVMTALQGCPAVTSGQIIVRLILSLNRTSPIESLERIVKLAKAWQKVSDMIIGLDVSGDPTRGKMGPILHLLERECPLDSRGQRVLPCCIHAGEVMNVAETESIISFCPDRLGHCCVLAEATRARLLNDIEPRIPLELCPTSNCLTLHLPTFDYHPQLDAWLGADYPIAICTDDSGVFNVSLSNEINLVASTRKLSKRQIVDLCTRSFDFLFCDSELKERLKARARLDAERLLAEAKPN